MHSGCVTAGQPSDKTGGKSNYLLQSVQSFHSLVPYVEDEEKVKKLKTEKEEVGVLWNRQ